MARIVEHASPPQTPTQKSRHASGLVRHASAPVRPHLALSSSAVTDGQRTRNRSSLPTSARDPASTSTPASRLLRQLSVAQVIVCRLRRDRDNWRANAEYQESQRIAHERALLEQQLTNARLEAQCAVLRAEHRASVAINNKMLDRLQISVLNQEKLVGQVKDLERGMARLKKSDRAKGKVWQRNLRLKATLHHYAARADFTSPPSNTNTTEALQEALAIASDRIEELESKGEALLHVLEGCDNDDENQDEDEEAANLLETTIAFRGALEDETCKELKEHWRELLEE